MTATAATPTISQVRKAGKILRQWWVGRKTAPFLTAAVVDAFDVLDSYRASHQYPLRKATMGLRSMVATIGSAGPVSQRLKRHVSILIKLEREPTMQLSTMQDVAGCRAVVEDMPHLRELEARWLKTRRVSRTYDYITTPKSSGYRGIHLIVHYDDTSVEVQLRTVVQHEWSVSVERVGGRIGEDLKGSRGPKEVLDFFSLAATAMEIEERGRPVPQDLSGAVRAARVRAWPFMKKGAP